MRLRSRRLVFGAALAGLSELVPEFLPAMPRDPVVGQPLRYRLAGESNYGLYSVGENGLDDGGDARSANETSKSHNWRDVAAKP